MHCVTPHKSSLKPPQASTPTDLISLRSQDIRRIEVFDIHRLIRRASFTSSKEVGPLVLRHLPLHPLFIFFFFFVNEFREKRGLQPCTRRRFCYVVAALRDVDRNTRLTLTITCSCDDVTQTKALPESLNHTYFLASERDCI